MSVYLIISLWLIRRRASRAGMEFKLVESYHNFTYAILDQEQKLPPLFLFFIFYFVYFLNKFLQSAHNLFSPIRHKIFTSLHLFGGERSIPTMWITTVLFFIFFSGARRGGGHDFFYFICMCWFGSSFQFQNLPPWLLTVLCGHSMCTVRVLVRMYVQLMPTAVLTNDNQRNELYSTPQPGGQI